MMIMMTGPLGLDDMRNGSGTSWLPDDSPMRMLTHRAGAWTLMLHGAAFLQFVDVRSPRGGHQVGSVNWAMAMAERDLAGGPLTVRAMLSLEPLTVGKCGYPDLLQSGEACNGAALHDQQHPHDLFMEIAADYRRAVTSSLAVEIYGGPSGEPALGPVAFPHRPSAMSDPIAPITHHWLDSSHISFGVVTGGVYGRRWKAEASAFNGREPDDRRYGFDLAPLDSYSGRVWFLPNVHWSVQASAGRLKEIDVNVSGSREDVTRITASVTHHRMVNDRLWATTVAWGQNREVRRSTSAVLAETAVETSPHDTWFVRAEVVGKTATDLALPQPVDAVFTVAKVAVGYTRWLAEGAGVKTGVGGHVGLAHVPAALTPFYGGRSPVEFGVFVTVRPR